MSSPNRNFQEQRKSEQAILNKSFDDDFQIQAVELGAWHDISDTIKRVLCDAFGRLVVAIGASVPATPTTSFLEYDSVVTVPDNSLTTIISHTVVTSDLLLDSIIATGTVDGEYTVVIDGDIKVKYRTSEQDRTVRIPFPVSQKIGVGSIIDVKVVHYEASLTGDFDASLIGHKD